MPTQTVTGSNAVLKSNSSTTNKVNIRAGASVNHNIVHTGNAGDEVKILEKLKPAGDRYTWYKVQYGNASNQVGWVREDVIELRGETNPSDAATLLYFVTEGKTLRIYTEAGKSLMNVYDNRREQTEITGVVTAKVPKFETSTTSSKFITYVAIKNQVSYYARFIPFGETELIIAGSNDGIITYREKGFRASGSEYRRNQ